MKRILLALTLTTFVGACGGGDAGDAAPGDAPSTPPAAATPAGPTAPTGPMSMPEWFAVDHDARTVSMTLTAGSTPDNNYWNYNGYIRGQIAMNVPEGYTVTIDLVNNDPNMAHSVGVSSEVSNFAMPPAPQPVFAGAITANPSSMIDATMPGETESITFVADAAGTYSLICYIPGHSAVGMWLFLKVTGDGAAGVQGM